MQDLAVTTIHFAEPGPQNTEATLSMVQRHASNLDIPHIVVASDTGKTARRALELLPDRKLVVVTNPAGLRFPVAKLHDYLPRFREHKSTLLNAGKKSVACSLSPETVEQLESAGATVHRMDWKRFQAFTRVGVNAIDRVGVGVRVALTVATWACIVKAVPTNSEVIAIAGTGFGGGGADTAVVVHTAERFKDFRVLETLCKPRFSPPSELPG